MVKFQIQFNRLLIQQQVIGLTSVKGLSKFDPCTLGFLRQALHPGVTHQSEQNVSGDRGMQCHVAILFCEIF